GRTGLDAQLLGDVAPTLPVVTVPDIDHIATRTAEDLRDRTGVIDIARRPVALHQQAADQVTRRAVVAHHLVDERLAVTTAVAVYVIELGVDPDIAAARIPTEAEILRGDGAGSGQRGNRSREREHPGLEQARVGHAWIGYGMVGHGFSCLQCRRWLRRNRRAGAVNTCRTRIRAVQQGRAPSHGQ